uniref:Uncharacterized protein n=1 Tax=Anopheles arabiensis TaxID=7173 RepID=A0A182HTS0_ANOAR
MVSPGKCPAKPTPRLSMCALHFRLLSSCPASGASQSAP